MTPDIKQRARGRWVAILSSLGVEEIFLRDRHGPCPLCGGKDRYRFDDKEDGLYYCNQCGAGDGFSLAMQIKGWDFFTAAKEVNKLIDTAPIVHKPQPTTEQIRAALKKISAGCVKAKADDPVGMYLKARGITSMPDVLFHPGLAYHGEVEAVYPAMVAIVRNQRDKPISLHRTYIWQGKKAPVESPRKGMKGTEKLHGGYIRLYQALPEMGIAEGIETACHAHQLFRLPVWSVINTTNMEQFNPPSGVTHLHIFADNDLNFAGQRSAFILANRLSLGGLKVSVHVPPWDGHDWADMGMMPDLVKVTEELKEFSPRVLGMKIGGVSV